MRKKLKTKILPIQKRKILHTVRPSTDRKTKLYVCVCVCNVVVTENAHSLQLIGSAIEIIVTTVRTQSIYNI